MIERKRRVESALESMGRMVVPVSDESEVERERVIDAVNRRLEMARRVRHSSVRQRWYFAAAAAAIGVAAGSALVHFRHVEATSQLATLEAPAGVFKRGDALRTEALETRSGTLEDGALVKLSGGTELTVSAPQPGGDELVLDRGRVDLSVPKLHSGHTLSVTTPDSTVTVRGTQFSVEVLLEGTHPITNVEVTQGSVWVRRGDARLVLEAGAHWSSRAPAPAALPALLADPVSTNEVTHAEAAPPKVWQGPSTSQARTDVSAPPALESSTLAQENDLYAAASRAARRGNDALAISNLNSLLSRYPNSPLAQNARVDRFRALGRSGRGSEAVAQARRYLIDYPNGFARDEAKSLVLQALAKP